jgi:hypothetical protein
VVDSLAELNVLEPQRFPCIIRPYRRVVLTLATSCLWENQLSQRRKDRTGGIEMTPPSNPRLTGGLPQQITVLVVTEIVAVRVVPAWTNLVLKRVPGVVQVLAVVCGLAYRLGLEMKGVMMKAGGCFVGKSVLGCE